MFAVDAQETTRRHAHGETFDVHGLALTQDNAILDEPCGRLTEHDTARRCRRFHPLGHAHLFTHCGVTEVGRADFTVITRPELRPTRKRRSIPSRRHTSTANCRTTC